MRGLICDDHPLLREALTEAVRHRWPEVELVACGDFPSAWGLAATQIDFCIVDLSMPGATPLKGVAKLCEQAPHMSVFVLTGLEDTALLNDIRAAGVRDVYSKNTEPDLLLQAIGLSVPALQVFEAKRLPRRQGQVLDLLAEGLTNKQIALQLRISPATVKIHVARLSAWLGAANRTDAVMRAKRARLI